MVNPRFEEITGYPADTLIRTGFQQITHPDDLDADVAHLARLNAGETQRYTMEKRYIRADGIHIWVNLTVAMVRDEFGQPEFYVAVVEDMSEIRQAQREASLDPLTGLLNRRGLLNRGVRMIRRAAREAAWLGIVYLDLDGFKALNDREGHSAGDRCLIDIARVLTRSVREQDVVSRVGGDEFVLMLADLPGGPARDLVDRLRIGLCGVREGVSGSFGLLTVSPQAADDLEALIDAADQAMLRAKRAGRNQVVVAG
jgi:diguanylate cyclase (GGDEF)-like protein/PAS domain S-box-containing protein